MPNATAYPPGANGQKSLGEAPPNTAFRPGIIGTKPEKRWPSFSHFFFFGSRQQSVVSRVDSKCSTSGAGCLTEWATLGAFGRAQTPDPCQRNWASGARRSAANHSTVVFYGREHSRLKNWPTIDLPNILSALFFVVSC